MPRGPDLLAQWQARILELVCSLLHHIIGIFRLVEQTCCGPIVWFCEDIFGRQGMGTAQQYGRVTDVFSLLPSCIRLDEPDTRLPFLCGANQACLSYGEV